MGQVASSGQNDFSFFNKKSIQSPDELQGYLDVLMKTRQDISDGNLVYDPSKTYMTFIVGDGDNVAFMKGGMIYLYYIHNMFCLLLHLAVCLQFKDEEVG